MSLNDFTRPGSNISDSEPGYYHPRGTFSGGAKVSANIDIVYNDEDASYYFWAGALPKSIPSGSTPENSGGVSVSGWVKVTKRTVAEKVGVDKINLSPTSDVTIADVMPLDVRRFGAKTVTEDPNFDSAPAFRAAIEYARLHSIGRVVFSGSYKLLSNHPTARYTLPYDDGTIAQVFKDRGETDIPSETIFTMPVVLEIPSYMAFEGENLLTSVLTFSWDGSIPSANATTIPQAVGIVTRVAGWPEKDRMVNSVRGITMKNFSVYNAFIGILSDGVMYYNNEISNIRIGNSGIPMLLQGTDSMRFNGVIGIEVCLTGIVIGGMWLTRNNIGGNGVGGVFVPPYVPGTDVYAAGWCDYTVFENITCSYGDQNFGDRHLAIDSFFDKFFYKSQHNAIVNPSTGQQTTGRMTKTTPQGAVSNYYKEPYRGISHRAFTNFSRYSRGNCNVQIMDSKIWACARVPFYTPNIQGTDYYGFLANVYLEQVGKAVINGANDWSNNHYASGKDVYNQDYTRSPAGACEGVMGCDKTTAQGCYPIEPSVAPRMANGVRSEVLWAADTKKFQYEQGVSGKSWITQHNVWSMAQQQWVWGERMMYGRHESQPHAYDREDGNANHHWRYRIRGLQSEIALCYNNVPLTNATVETSFVHSGGFVTVYFRIVFPGDTSSYTQDMSIRWLPPRVDGMDFGFKQGTDFKPVLYDMVGTDYRPVYKTNTNPIPSELVGYMQQLKVPVRVRHDTGALRMYSDPQGVKPLAISDFAGGSVMEFSITYVGKWNFY